MKKMAIGVATFCIAAAFLVGQDSTTAPATKAAASKSAASDPSLPRSSASAPTTNTNARYKIAMKYQPGTKYEIMTKVDVTVSWRDQSTGQAVNYSCKIEFKCYLDMQKSADDGKTVGKMSFARIVGRYKKNDDDESVIDTDKPETLSTGGLSTNRDFALMIETEYAFHFDSDGNVIKVDGIDDLVAKRLKGYLYKMDANQIEWQTMESSAWIQSLVVPAIVYANCQFDEVGQNYGRAVFDVPSLATEGQKSVEKLTVKLASIDDSSAGKIAIVDIDGTMEYGGQSVPRFGQIKFNLDKNMVESIRLELTQGNGGAEKLQFKTETEIKIVDKIPARVAASQPASAPAETQPSR